MNSQKKNESKGADGKFDPPSPATSSNGRTKVVDEGDNPNGNFSVDDILSGFDEDWKDYDPLTAPRLADFHRAEQERLRVAVQAGKRSSEPRETTENSEEFTGTPAGSEFSADKITTVERLLDSVNQAAMPFHHLIPAALLIPSARPTGIVPAVDGLRPANPAERRQKFWQLLAARGVSAKEAALLNDSLSCSYLEIGDDRRLTEIDWEVLHRDPLEGCAELYLAEMFLCKQPIYEAGDDLRVALELNGDDVARHLPEETFAPLVGDRVDNLLLDALSASFTLSVSTNKKILHVTEMANGGNEEKKAARLKTGITFSDYFSRHATGVARRAEFWLSDSNLMGENGRTIYRLRLGEYWLGWQRAARAARFDFDYLSNASRCPRRAFLRADKAVAHHLRPLDEKRCAVTPLGNCV